MKAYGVILFAGLLTLFTVSCSFAASADGARIVRIEDGVESRCINFKTDSISLHLRRFIVNKDVSWFSADTEVGLLLQTVMGNGVENSKPFPRMFKATLSPYAKGQVSLPVEQRIFHQYVLKPETTTINSIDLTFTVLKKRKKANFGIVLEQLANVTKGLPLPPNPYVKAFEFFTNYADTVVNQSLNAENNVDDQLKEGQISLAFSGTDVCRGDNERTGTVAVVKAAVGAERDGYADINKEYCWKAQTTPAFEVYFAPRAQGSCTGAGPFTKLNNAYYGFFLNSERPGGAKSAEQDARVQRDLAASLARCKQHGVEACL